MNLKNRLKKTLNQAIAATKAFTMIELVVVMAVIAILVLLAMPWFANRTGDARLTQAMNDAKVIGTKMDEYLLIHESLNPRLTLEDKARLESLIGDGRLADKGGLAEGLDSGDYFIVPDDFIKIDLDIKRPGKDDVYSSDDGHVVIDLGGGELTQEDDEEIPLVCSFDGIPESARVEEITLGSGTASDPYQLWFLEHLDAARKDLNGHYLLMRDLNFDNHCDYVDSETNQARFTFGSGWNTIGANDTAPFTGVLDGQSYSLSNLYINKPISVDYNPQYYQGLFGYIYGAEIRNLNMKNVYVVSEERIGGLVGEAEFSILDNISVSGFVKANSWDYNSYVGGIVGQAGNTTIKNSSSSARIFGLNDIGGIAGLFYSNPALSSEGIILNCANTGTVSGEAPWSNSIGGLVGTLDGAIIRDSRNLGVVGGYYNVGGLVGFMKNALLEDSYSAGAVYGIQAVGGAVGQQGWFPSYSAQAKIRNVAATGDVFSGLYYDRFAHESVNPNTDYSSELTSIYYVGGFIGMNSGRLETSFARNNVTVTGLTEADVYGKQIGGFAGYHRYTSPGISDSYFIGNISGLTELGAFAGYNSNGTISNSYAVNLSGPMSFAGGVGTTAVSLNNYVNDAVPVGALPAGFATDKWTVTSGGHPSLLWEGGLAMTEASLKDSTYYEHIPPEGVVETMGDYVFKKGDKAIVSYLGTATELEIPASFTVNGTVYPVQKIDTNAFNNNKTIKTLTIPGSVKRIEYGAFAQTDITTLFLNEGLEYIGDSAFYESMLSGLVTIPDSVAHIGNMAFRDSYIKSLTLGAGLEYIGYEAFLYNEITSSISLSDKLGYIGEKAFRGNGITGEIVLHDSVTTLGKDAFISNKITKLTIGSGLTMIDRNAFNSNQITDIHIPSNIKTIGISAFYNNPFSTVTFESGIQTIGTDAFYNWSGSSIVSVVFPPSITRIESRAFYGNSNLSSIIIKKSSGTVFIGTQAFTNTAGTPSYQP